jgi:hypothetical protein
MRDRGFGFSKRGSGFSHEKLSAELTDEGVAPLLLEI